MATAEQRAEQLQGVKEKLNELVALDPQALRPNNRPLS